MFCTFLATDLVVVGRYDPAVDPENAAHLDQVADDLAGLTTRRGPVRIERVPMPDHDDGFWRTYTNLIFANEAVLVPVYPEYCPELDQIALELYRRLLPDRRIIGIDTSELIKMNGALRCITMNVPIGVLQPADRAATP
jgi:agmatine deiminase